VLVAEDSDFDGSSFPWVFPQNQSLESSEIVNESPSVVRYNGKLYQVEYSRTRSPLSRQEIQYETELVANNETEFRREHLDQLVTQTNASTPTGPERDVITDTLQESAVTIEGHDRPDSARDTRNWMITHPSEGQDAFVEYNGSLYRFEYDHQRRE
jgi:hypothetical protein